MFLRIYLNKLSANDADYYVREFAKLGANVKIAFGKDENHAVLIQQAGELEKLLETASVAFKTESFRVEIHN